MRKLLMTLLLIAPLAVDLAQAQSGAITVICLDCRDPHEHPEDYANFAFNQVFGEDGWMSLDQADDFFIVNLQGERLYVDIDLVFLGVGVEGFRLPFWPTNTVQITLALPNGTIYTTTRSVYLSPLPVPSYGGTGAGEGAETSGGGENADEGVDEPEGDDENKEGEWEEPEPDYVGHTGIEDPDEYGEFDDPDWCEEC